MNKKIQVELEKGRIGHLGFKRYQRKRVAKIIGVNWDHLNFHQRSVFQKDMLLHYKGVHEMRSKSFYENKKPAPNTNVMTRDQWDKSSISKEVKRLFS